jgi:homoserine dehydrogenase
VETSSKQLRIGLAGLGNVGSGVYKNLLLNRHILQERTGAHLKVTKIAVRDPGRKRDVDVSPEMLTTEWRELIDDPQIDVIVELIGGDDEAFALITAALEARKVVVTGNKAVLAKHGKQLIELSEKQNTPLYCEAAVAGGIPIIKAVKEALVGNRIDSIYGIINGTSNYILTRMTTAGISFSEALEEAREKGFAEADPSLDINGWDAGHKAIILGWLSYGRWLKPEEVSVTGIEKISSEDVAFANSLGYEIKLLGVIRQSQNDDRIEVRVAPSLIPRTHILSSVDGVFNAVAVHGNVVGETLFYGSGAGQDATSSAVISDLADAAENLMNEVGCTGFVPHGDYGAALPIEETLSQYYLRLSVVDEPGVLARIASITGENGIGILSVIQPEPKEPSAHIPLVLLLHDAAYGTVSNALKTVLALDSVESEHTLLRVETLER